MTSSMLSYHFSDTTAAQLTEYVHNFENGFQYSRIFRGPSKLRTKIFEYFTKTMKLSYNHSTENYWLFRSTSNNLELAIQITWNESEKNVSISDSFNFEIWSAKEYADQFIEEFQKLFELSEVTTYNVLRASWAFLNTRNEIDYVSLSVHRVDKFIDEMYPFIGNVDQFIDDFINSSSMILILLGDPGLGKSTFIKYLLAKTGWRSQLAYDESVMSRDELYLNFLRSESNVLILEDSDTLLRSRLDDNNKIMSKILNVSNGILDTGKKKMIFTANIENAKDIDPALVRPGRCFAVKMFRPLTLDEATIASEKIGKTIFTNKESFTVAEIYQGKDMKSNIKQLAQGMGF